MFCSSGFCCCEMQRLEGLDGSVWTAPDFPGKRPEMDVGFGPSPDKCYSKLVKVKFVTRNSSRPMHDFICSRIGSFFTGGGERVHVTVCPLALFCSRCIPGRMPTSIEQKQTQSITFGSAIRSYITLSPLRLTMHLRSNHLK